MAYKRYFKRGGKTYGPYYYTSKKMPDGEFKDIVHPINQIARDNITKAVIDKFEALEVIDNA